MNNLRWHLNKADSPVGPRGELALRLRLWLMQLAMAAGLGAVGWLWAGLAGSLLILALWAWGMRQTPLPPLASLAQAQGWQWLHPAWNQELYRLLQGLSSRANLEAIPHLLLSPQTEPNAFALQTSQGPALVLTQGLVRLMNQRELAGVLAHEVAHLHHRDLTSLNQMAQAVGLAQRLAWAGMLVILFHLPLVWLGWLQVSWFSLGLLALLPWLGQMLWFALSRNQEFQADATAASLTDDPRGLASALAKLAAHRRWWNSWWPWGRPNPEAGIFDSHPRLEERIRRLQSRPKWPS